MMTFHRFMQRMAKLDRQGVIALAHRAGISEHTLIKVWRGDTASPGILLVELVWRHMGREEK